MYRNKKTYFEGGRTTSIGVKVGCSGSQVAFTTWNDDNEIEMSISSPTIWKAGKILIFMENLAINATNISEKIEALASEFCVEMRMKMRTKSVYTSSSNTQLDSWVVLLETQSYNIKISKYICPLVCLRSSRHIKHRRSLWEEWSWWSGAPTNKLAFMEELRKKKSFLHWYKWNVFYFCLPYYYTTNINRIDLQVNNLQNSNIIQSCLWFMCYIDRQDFMISSLQ